VKEVPGARGDAGEGVTATCVVVAATVREVEVLGLVE
jgi:hypothetical protein